MLCRDQAIVYPNDFEDGVSCLKYQTAQDAIHKAREWLLRPDDLNALRIAGHAHALNHHTNYKRACMMLDYVGMGDKAKVLAS